MNKCFNGMLAVTSAFFIFSCNTPDAASTTTSLQDNSIIQETEVEPGIEDAVKETSTQPASDTLTTLNTNTPAISLSGGGFWAVKNKDLNTLLVSKVVRDPENMKKLTDIFVKGAKEEELKALARLAAMNEEEISLLDELPVKDQVNNEQSALAVSKGLTSRNIEQYRQSGKASDLFEKIIEQNNKALQKHSAAILKKVGEAKAAFQVKNPNMNLQSGNTYFDEKNNAVHLPMGDLSFADEVISHIPGKPAGKFGERALGAPNYKGDEKNDIAYVGYGGVLTLYFRDNAIVDVNGPDIYVFEVGAIEPTQLAISKDGENWIEIGKIKGGTAEVDINGFVPAGESYQYVRFTDLKSPSDIPGADIDAVACIGSAMRMTLSSGVLFDFGKYDLKPEAADELKKLAQKINILKGGSITVEGHTDDIGQDAENKILSEKRAQSVANALRSLLPGTNFKWQIKGFGENQPLKPNTDDANRQENRRVEVLVML